MVANRFDRKVRCEFEVDRPGEAEEVLSVCGWRWDKVAPQTYQADVEVRGGMWGASRRARGLLITELHRHGLRARLRWVRLLDVPMQSGDRLPVHEVRVSRRTRLERFLVACGARDIGACIQAVDGQDAQRQLMLLVSAHGEDRDLKWRTRFGQPLLPAVPGAERPKAVGWTRALAVSALSLGIILGSLGGGLVPIVVGAVLAPLSAASMIRLRRRPAWGLVPLTAMGGGVWLGSLTGMWYVWPAVALAVLMGIGLRHLARDLSLAEKASWAFPAALPVLVPLTAAIGDLAYGRYLGALGLSREDIALGLWDRLGAAAVPVGVAFGVALTLLGCVGWLRYLHIRLPVAAALMVIGIYLVSGAATAAGRGADAAARPGHGFGVLLPARACAFPLKTRIASRGSMLLVRPRPLLYLELSGDRIALWDPVAVHRRGLEKVAAGDVQLVRIDDGERDCQALGVESSSNSSTSVPTRPSAFSRRAASAR
ncbi:hypothetical protein [Sphaerisporangium corydalis]|nr:hypothetical protein [Sphaerisporangium corydalis]